MIRIAVVDDQHLFRQSLCALLKGIEQFTLVAQAADGHAFLELIKQLPARPDIALVDMDMPGMNGIELTGYLRDACPGIKIIALTVFNQERYIRKMVEAGACGYLVKNCTADELVTAIEAAHRTGFYFNEIILKALQKALQQKDKVIRNINNIPIELTNREQKVLQLICRELTNAEIAAQLFLSIRTVEGYRNSLLAKTGCRNTAGLVIFAIRYGIYQMEL